MEKIFVCLLPKSPWSQGRIGPPEWQDWYRGCVKAAKIANKNPDCFIVMPSEFKNGNYIETVFYRTVLCGLVKKSSEKVFCIPKGNETISQLNAFFQCFSDKGKCIIVSTFLHFPRVWWLCRGKGAKHKIVFGIPRPKEMVADIILAFVFPIIDSLGKREWWLKKVSARRESGKI